MDPKMNLLLHLFSVSNFILRVKFFITRDVMDFRKEKLKTKRNGVDLPVFKVPPLSLES